MHPKTENAKVLILTKINAEFLFSKCRPTFCKHYSLEMKLKLSEVRL
jgi:hypothetical protein